MHSNITAHPFLKGPAGTHWARVQGLRIYSSKTWWKFWLMCDKCKNHRLASWLLGFGFYSISGVKFELILVLGSQFFEYLRKTSFKYALEHVEGARPQNHWLIFFLPAVNTWLFECLWLSGHIFGTIASHRQVINTKMPKSPSSTVDGGQYDTKYVTFELLSHAAFMADKNWGFTLEPARIYDVCEWNLRYMVTDTQFHNLYGRPFARVLSLFFMKGTAQWLPWVLPGSTGRLYKVDAAYTSPFSAMIQSNQHRRRRMIFMILVRVKQNKTKLSENCHTCNTRTRSGYILYERQFDWCEHQNQRTTK